LFYCNLPAIRGLHPYLLSTTNNKQQTAPMMVTLHGDRGDKNNKHVQA
jgi:hypothetical protein